MDYKEIAEVISKAKKTTPSIVFLKGKVDLSKARELKLHIFGFGEDYIIIGDWEDIKKIIIEQKDIYVDVKGRYSAIPLVDLRKLEARIEPGAIIREGAKIGKDSIILMGAVVNIGAEIGDRTMIDMNAVIGARAIIGKDCHIGAGAVIAGVLEPPSEKPVIIEDNVIVGANAVVLEGVNIKRGSIVGAGAVVIEDVPEGKVVAGVPARIIKDAKDVKEDKKKILKELRER
jgi:2,3,4,5-tetrahydropyridine-2-carboxylate N-succinyltransferase/tetrahydrodipicolinate N-acetyltransferase